MEEGKMLLTEALRLFQNHDIIELFEFHKPRELESLRICGCVHFQNILRYPGGQQPQEGDGCMNE